MDENEIMEPKEVAKLLKVNQRTVTRWAEQKKLPGFKLGDLWRFRRSTIEEYIRKLEAGTIDNPGSKEQEGKTIAEDNSDTLLADKN
jgi:excisionase family DNA binding protein